MSVAYIALCSLFSILLIISNLRLSYWKDKSTFQQRALDVHRENIAALQRRNESYKHQIASFLERENAPHVRESTIKQDVKQLSAQQGSLKQQIETQLDSLHALLEKEKQLRSSIDALQIRQKELILSVNSLDKTQQALDRFISSNRNERQIGLDFERYVGFLYEQDGYMVCYSGANLGKEDHPFDRSNLSKSIRFICFPPYALYYTHRMCICQV